MVEWPAQHRCRPHPTRLPVLSRCLPERTSADDRGPVSQAADRGPRPMDLRVRPCRAWQRLPNPRDRTGLTPPDLQTCSIGLHALQEVLRRLADSADSPPHGRVALHAAGTRRLLHAQVTPGGHSQRHSTGGLRLRRAGASRAAVHVHLCRRLGSPQESPAAVDRFCRAVQAAPRLSTALDWARLRARRSGSEMGHWQGFLRRRALFGPSVARRRAATSP